MTISRRALFGSVAAGAALAATSVAPAFGVDVRTVFIAGDSTAADKATGARPEAGWGMALPWYTTPHLRVENHAINGRSSRSFIDEGRLDGILGRIRPGDILLVQFAHSDEKASAPELHTEPWSTYQEHLARYIAGARDRGATPVLATPVERRRFDTSGNAYETHGEYPAAMRALAASQGVALIDAHAKSLALWQRLGPEETKRHFLFTDDGRRDSTHLQPRGAAAVARIVAGGLLAQGVAESHEVRRLDRLAPLSAFSWRADAAA